MRDFYEAIVGPGPFLYRGRHGRKGADSHHSWTAVFYHRTSGGRISSVLPVLA